MQDYFRTKKGVVSRMYADQRAHSVRRKHPMPDYTKKELSKWLFSQLKFHELFNNWELSGFDKLLKPSCDRKRNNKPYTIANLQVVTWDENNKNGNRDIRAGKVMHGVNPQKPVIGIHKTTQEVIFTHSIMEAERKTGISNKNISECCRGNRKTAGGYIWRYK